VSASIPVEHLDPFLAHPSDDACEHDLLAGEIAGLSSRLNCIPAGGCFRFHGDANTGVACIVFSGRGAIHADGLTHRVEDLTLFAARRTGAFSITAEDGTMRLLTLRVDLTEDDRREFDAREDRYPWIMPYSQCATYTERIKSSKTVNRTLLPENTFPRLCIGSVQTSGDDQVAAHKHPMLEQLFFGLKSNRCTVTADDAKVAFGRHDLLHIPLGSVHSVEVRSPDQMHYLWIDLFKDQAGMDYIAQEHKSQ